MSVIAAIAHQGTVWMGADSVSTREDGSVFYGAQKVVRRPVPETNREVLIGATGAAPLGRLWQRVPLEPVGAGVTMDDWVLGIAEAWTRLAVADEPSHADEAGHLDGSALIATDGRLWRVSENHAMDAGPYAAEGCGGALALGALHALHPQVLAGTVEPVEAVVTALSAAVTWDAHCGGEVRVELLTRSRSAPRH